MYFGEKLSRLFKGGSRHKNWCMARVLSFLIRYFSNYYTLHRSDLAARAAPLDPRLKHTRNKKNLPIWPNEVCWKPVKCELKLNWVLLRKSIDSSHYRNSLLLSKSLHELSTLSLSTSDWAKNANEMLFFFLSKFRYKKLLCKVIKNIIENSIM